MEERMTGSYAASLVHAYNQIHQRTLKLADQMTDTQLAWQASPTSHTIAFHLWHIARWADHFQAAVPGMTPELGRRLAAGAQIWDQQGVAGRWGWSAAALGFDSTGMHMPDEIARTLAFPPRAELLAYARSAFEAAERATGAIDQAQLGEQEQKQPLTAEIWGAGTVGDALLAHVTHSNRHLGAIECLYGIQAGSGTATV
jgi:hypothetical protein